MIYGKMVGELVVITTLEDGGKEITETAPPSTIPDNYRLEYHWEDQGAQIMQVWTLSPVGGTEQDAMLTLAKIQARGQEWNINCCNNGSGQFDGLYFRSAVRRISSPRSCSRAGSLRYI